MSYFKLLLLSLLAVLAPIKAVLITTGVLIISDFIVGIMAAWKRGEPITSANMRRTISKLVIFEIAVISAFLIEKYLLDGAVPATKLVSGIIGVTEGKSILENVEIIYGKPLFKAVLKQLSSHNDEDR